MKILHINTNIGGGASTAAVRIHKALCDNGFDSHILFLKGKIPDDIPNAHTLEDFYPVKKVFFLDKLNRLLNYRFQIGRKKSFFNSPKTVFRFQKLDFFKEFDVIHLHWVVKMVDIPSFFKIKQAIAWTMHDMNPFSGGMHYFTDFYEDDYLKLEKKFREIKKKAYSREKIGIIGPSKWLLEEAQKSQMFPSSTIFKNIKYPIDLELFSPKGNKEEKAKKTVLFVAEKSADERKGSKFLYEAVSMLKDEDVEFVVLGNPDENCPNFVTQAGFISSEKEIMEWYRKADVFVIPSLEDNLPNTVIEALACGTPVVGFEVGGIKDMILHKENGYLVPLKDSKTLSEGIKYVLQNHLRLSKNAREFAKENFSGLLISSQYRKFYEQLIQN